MAALQLSLALQVALASPSDTGRSQAPLGYSLAAWADRVWNQLADREGGIFGRLATQGIFQRYHPLQDHEYRLDEFTGAFSLDGEADWHARTSAVRAWGASISNKDFINAVEAKLAVPLARRLHSRFRLFQEETLEADRQRIVFTLDFDSAIASWTPWFGMTLEFVKPDADVEFGARRTFGRHLQLSFLLSLLDAFNDFNFVTLGVDSAETDFFREYLTQPVALRYAVEWRPTPRWRLESHGGITNRAHLKGDLLTDTLRGFDQLERTRFLGVLAEWSPELPRLAVGVFARIAEAKIARGYELGDSIANFRLMERTEAVGGYALFRPSRQWQAEASVLYTARPERRVGDGAVNLDDREWSAWLNLWYRVAGSIYLSAGYFYDDRALSGDSDLQDALAATNQRGRTDIDFRFPSGARLGMGANWDLDFPTAQSFFDGAHGRLVLPF